ncbi:hypothetical protein, partial [Sphingomonas sp.]
MSVKGNEFNYNPVAVPDTALFVAADEPLLVYPSPFAAQRHLEAIDVENGIYPAAYGPRGEHFTIRTEGSRVVIEPTGGFEHAEEFRVLLLRYLESQDINADTSDLESLVEKVWKIECEFWEAHDPFGDRFGTRIPASGCVAGLLVAAAALY